MYGWKARHTGRTDSKTSCVPEAGLPLIIHLKVPRLFPDLSQTFYSFPYPVSDQKFFFINLYLNGANCITSNLGFTLKGKNLLHEGANSFP